jgi:peptidoglycan/LPS O-acetylase OafA/YrhL
MDLRVPEKKFRPELEGVRTVAALLVAVYHIWIGAVSGGVDVFFIVSGYLITTSLVSKVEREGRIQFAEYWLGLARRLFPLAFTVLLFVVVGSILLVPESQWKQIIGEVIASGTYTQNWYLATSAVDYLGQTNQASPLQHFWALSIQGQFYLTWPFVILFSFWLARKVWKKPQRKTLLGVLLVLFALSMTYSIYRTAVEQPWAYFDTFARAWEFSLGGILALLLPYLRFPKAMGVILGWIGLSIICLTGILLQVSTVFPGYAALLPTGGVIMIIIAAENGSRFGAEKLLGSKPFQAFGSISYGFYLWHWPLLIFYYAKTGANNMTFIPGLAIMISAAILAYISVRMMEKPVRKMSVRTSKKKLIFTLALFLFTVMGSNTAWGYYVHQKGEETYAIGDYPGARALSEGITPAEGKAPAPSPALVKEDLPSFYDQADCFSNMEDDRVTKCSMGDTKDPEHTIALVGGSHSGHWFPALEELSDDLHLKIDIYNKDACRFSADDFDGALNGSCMEWNRTVVEMLKKDPPDLVFTTANVGIGDTVPKGYLDQWKKLEGVTEIFAVRDNPAMEGDPVACVEQNGIEACSPKRSDVLSPEVPWERLDPQPSNVTFADLSGSFCQEGTCPPVVGNVYVYRDYHHISTLYSKTLAGPLKEPLREALK